MFEKLMQFESLMSSPCIMSWLNKQGCLTEKSLKVLNWTSHWTNDIIRGGVEDLTVSRKPAVGWLHRIETTAMSREWNWTSCVCTKRSKCWWQELTLELALLKLLLHSLQSFLLQIDLHPVGSEQSSSSRTHTSQAIPCQTHPYLSFLQWELLWPWVFKWLWHQ